MMWGALVGAFEQLRGARRDRALVGEHQCLGKAQSCFDVFTAALSVRVLVRISGLQVAAELKIGTAEQQPAIEVVRVRFEPCFEARDHLCDGRRNTGHLLRARP